MHEFSLAQEAVDKIIKEAKNKNAKEIKEIELIIGELNHLGKERMEFWFREILSSKCRIADDVKINIQEVRSEAICKACSYRGGLSSDAHDHFSHTFKCPSCGGSDLEIKKGMEFIINRVQLEV